MNYEVKINSLQRRETAMSHRKLVLAIFLVSVLNLTVAFPAPVFSLSQSTYGGSFGEQAEARQAPQETQTGETAYPWPMNGHDYQRTFFSDSPAPETPNLLWKANMSDSASFGPVVAEGKVFQGSYEKGDVYAWDANTGKLMWMRHLNNSAHGISYFNGKLYCGGGTLPHDPVRRITGDIWVCLDAKTGETIWTYHIPERLILMPGRVGLVLSQPTVYENKTYVRVKDGYVILNPDTGEVISEWLEGFGDFSRCPSFYEGDIFGIYNYTNVYRADPTTREVKWTSPPLFVPPSDPSDVWGFILVNPSASDVYLAGDLSGGHVGESMQNVIYRLDALSGTVYWKFLAGGQVNSIATSYNRLFFGSSDGYFYCLDKFVEWVPIWKVKTGGAILGDPAVAGEKVYFGSFDRYVYCLNVWDGELIWKYRTDGPLSCNAAIADGKLYIPSNDGYMYCFGLSPPKPSSAISLSAPSKATVDNKLEISGKLVDQAGAGIGNANVTLQYRVFPMTEWTDVATVMTASDGSYRYTWIPPYEGYYDFAAAYAGDAYEPSQAKSTVKVSAPPLENATLLLYAVAASITSAIASIIAAICIVVFSYKHREKRSERKA